MAEATSASAEETTANDVSIWTTSSLINVSNTVIVYSMIPLLLVMYVSHRMNLGLESSIFTGMIRTFIQLTILGYILHPIFIVGESMWYVVILYVFLMIVLAAYESTSIRACKYYFPGMFFCVLASLLMNIVVVALFTFLFLISPNPIWDPQYVIPIIGMLLGNSINGVSLSLNSMLSAFVENSTEIELYLSFGATSYEACSRLLRDAVRSGTTPQLNSMAIIGLVSIPGMMTGQILGGSPVIQAARYQMLIMYIIAFCTFGTIITEIYIALKAGFDKEHTLRTEHFIHRSTMSLKGNSKKQSFMKFMMNECLVGSRYLMQFLRLSSSTKHPSISVSSPDYDADASPDEISYLAPKGQIEVSTMFKNFDDVDYDVDLREDADETNVGKSEDDKKGESSKDKEGETNKENEKEKEVPFFQICDLTHSVEIINNESDIITQEKGKAVPKKRRILFKDFNVSLECGEIVSVMGPSGIGKTTLLRMVAGLIPLQAPKNGVIYLQGQTRSAASMDDMTIWRQQVRYISQNHKMNIPGTPQDFLRKIITFHVWKNLDHNGPPSYAYMITKTCELLTYWGIPDATLCLETEWKLLSSGEIARVLLAFALSSKPKVLLLDEVTANLDYETKLCIEESMEEYCCKESICVLWITHDQDQIDRFQSINNETTPYMMTTGRPITSSDNGNGNIDGDHAEMDDDEDDNDSVSTRGSSVIVQESSVNEEY